MNVSLAESHSFDIDQTLFILLQSSLHSKFFLLNLAFINLCHYVEAMYSGPSARLLSSVVTFCNRTTSSVFKVSFNSTKFS